MSSRTNWQGIRRLFHDALAQPAENRDAFVAAAGTHDIETREEVRSLLAAHEQAVAATRVEGQTAEEYITESILDPNAHIAPDCPTGPCPDPSVMPATFGEQLSDEQLTNLVLYLLSLE